MVTKRGSPPEIIGVGRPSPGPEPPQGLGVTKQNYKIKSQQKGEYLEPSCALRSDQKTQISVECMKKQQKNLVCTIEETESSAVKSHMGGVGVRGFFGPCFFELVRVAYVYVSKVFICICICFF